MLSLFGISSTQTNAVQTALSNGYADSFVEYARAHNNLFLRILGDIAAVEPYAFFVILVGIFFLFILLGRWYLHIVSLRNKAGKRIFRNIIRFVFSYKTMFTVILVLCVVLTEFFQTPDDLKHVIRVILFSVLLFMLFRSGGRFIRVYFRYLLIYRHTKKMFGDRNKNLHLLFYRTSQVFLWLLCMTIFLGLLGVQIGSILAGLGVAGIVAGLALQDSVSHLVGGVSLMLDKVYSVGDIVKLHDVNIDGVVYSIGFRSTKIRTWDEEIVIIPNGLLAKMTITNFSQPIERKRVKIFYQIASDSAPPEKAKILIMDALESVPMVLKNPAPYIVLFETKGSTYTLRVCYYVEDMTLRLVSSDEVQTAVRLLFRENEVRLSPDEQLIRYVKESSS